MTEADKIVEVVALPGGRYPAILGTDLGQVAALLHDADDGHDSTSESSSSSALVSTIGGLEWYSRVTRRFSSDSPSLRGRRRLSIATMNPPNAPIEVPFCYSSMFLGIPRPVASAGKKRAWLGRSQSSSPHS